jgi:hypothetical protein
MKKQKTLKQLKRYHHHYLVTFPQVKRRGQITVWQHLNKLKAQIDTLTSQEKASAGCVS